MEDGELKAVEVIKIDKPISDQFYKWIVEKVMEHFDEIDAAVSHEK